MKTIYIVRHAKTGHHIDDFERELLPIGIDRTHKLGDFLAAQHCQVKHIYTSDAKRALQTSLIIAEHLGLDKNLIIKEHASNDALIKNRRLRFFFASASNILSKLCANVNTFFYFF